MIACAVSVAIVPLSTGVAQAANPPTIDPIPNQCWNLNQSIPPLSITAHPGTGGPITEFFTPTGLPSGSFTLSGQSITNNGNDVTVVLTGTPTATGFGTAHITVQDSSGDTATASWNWSVPSAPCGSDVVTVQPIPDQSFAVGLPVSITIQASSSTNRSLGYSATGLPAGLSIPNGAQGGNVITGAATAQGSGTATITVNDPNDITATTSFNWTVVNLDRTEVAFQANTGHLWTDSPGNGAGDTGFGMLTGTSPAITTPSTALPEVAFQANTGHLWTDDLRNGAGDTGFGMMAGTSPAITTLTSGQVEIAFQANTGNLWLDIPGSGAGDTGFGMMAGTSPAITALPNGQVAVAFQANSGHLWIVIPGVSHTDTGLGMMAGTSPAITTLTTGQPEVAFQANTGHLWTDIPGGSHTDTGLGMLTGTSPAIIFLDDAYVEIAFQANTGRLWLDIPGFGAGDTGFGMMAGTSPAIVTF